MTKNATLWTTVKDDLRERRVRRATTRQLRADLAGYRTPSDIEDLLVTIEAHEADRGVVDGDVIRQILHENLRRYHAEQAPLRRAAGL